MAQQQQSKPQAQQPAQPAPTQQAQIPAQTFTEAPASINLRFDYRGANIQLTLRDVSGSAILSKLDPVLDRLEQMGATLPSAGGGGAEPVAPAGAPVCPTHGKPMKQSKHGGWFCPAKVADNDGTGKPIYCKQKVD